MAIYGDPSFSHNSTGNWSLIMESSDWDDAMMQMVIDFKESQLTLSEPKTIILITLYVPIFILSLIGNVLVLLVILPNQRMWSVTNNFLVNLAVADLLVTLLCVPMTVAGKVYRLWVYGDVLCKLTPYLQGVSVTASTFTITAMSLDRCLAILHPMKFRSLRTTKYVRVLIFFVWLTAVLLMMPLLFVNQTTTQELFPGIQFTRCSEMWTSLVHRRAYDFSLLFIVCIIPAQIVLISYILMGKRLWVVDARLKSPENDWKSSHSGSCSERGGGMEVVRANRRRIAKMCVVVSVVFVVCWTPYYTVNIYLDFKGDANVVTMVYWTLLLGHLHCISNPILYCYMHKTFRHCVKRLLSCSKGMSRLPSGYGTAFTQCRNSRALASLRSSKRSLKVDDKGKTPLQRVSSNSSSSGNVSAPNNDTKSADYNTRPGSDSALETTRLANNASRRVHIVFSKLRSKKQRKPTCITVVEIPSAIKEETTTCTKTIDS